ncbi:hypothetical protein [Photobacterium phosphoreum]|uniref:hypothetical protein n=1 Tax=Photobacterium phosphoreum TaxID=659 RepID=UPI001E5031C9|nr:hypothetical protein [Photobacterium phosphoreum]MCD9506159.1 hypothetical protein [Photobacterium phosphoreum]
MTTDRLNYLFQKCKRQLLKKRDSDARVWLEIALDEFPNSRELHRFAGKTYLQWGMTQKAIHFLEFDSTKDTFENPNEGYDHNKVTQDDLSIIEDQFDCRKTPNFVSPPQKAEASTPIRKTLTLNKKSLNSKPSKIEIDSIFSNCSGEKQIVVKHVKTRKTSNTTETAVENKSSSHRNSELSIPNIITKNRFTTLSQEASTYSESSFIPMLKDGFNSIVSDELQDIPTHSVPFLHKIVGTESNTNSTPSLLKQIDDFEPHIEHEQSFESNFDHFSQVFITEDENTSYDTKQDWVSEQHLPFNDDSLSENDELGWTQESLGLEFYQDAEILLDLAEEDCELFDYTDDAFISAFEDEDLEEEEEQFIDNDRHKLTRWERARQVAVEVIYSTNWSGKHLTFLTDIFFENGWGAVRVTMEKEIQIGTTIDELMLARDFKEIWKNCDRYWITLSKLSPTAHVTEATYKNMSWAQALKIIRCYNWLPSIDELEVFVEEEFEYWYQHALMRRVYPVFMKYLCYYRAKNTPYMDFELKPYCQQQNDDPMDNGDLINCNSEYRQRLSYAGLDSIRVKTL